MLINIVLVVHVLAAVAIVILVLLQQGRGADAGAAFGGGGGGSQSLFGAQGSANFLSRTTALLAAIFFFTSLSLAYIYNQGTERRSVTETTPVVETQSDIPAVPQSDAVDTDQGSEIPTAPSGENQ